MEEFKETVKQDREKIKQSREEIVLERNMIKKSYNNQTKAFIISLFTCKFGELSKDVISCIDRDPSEKYE